MLHQATLPGSAPRRGAAACAAIRGGGALSGCCCMPDRQPGGGSSSGSRASSSGRGKVVVGAGPGGVNKGLGLLEWTGKVVPQGLLVGGRSSMSVNGHA
eukprot:298641-Chlamydomonas_euryale.AAC.4